MPQLEFPLEEITDTPEVEGYPDPPVKQAYLATCRCVPGVEETSFHIFQFPGMDHFHFQCTRCETSYCPIACNLLPQQRG
jgi:hypothetical protein